MSKITKSTFKSFLRKNEGKLFIKCKSSFDGMIDGTRDRENPQYRPLTGIFGHAPREGQFDNTMGYHGIWLVGDSGDRFYATSEAGFEGYEVSNCCGCFIVAVKAEMVKEAA